MKYALVVLFLILSSCTTVPSFRELDGIRNSAETIQPQTGSVIISSFQDGEVYVNGVYQDGIRSNDTLELTLPQGAHVVSFVFVHGPRAGEEIFQRVEVLPGTTRAVAFDDKTGIDQTGGTIPDGATRDDSASTPGEAPDEGTPSEKRADTLVRPAPAPHPGPPSGTMVVLLPAGMYEGDVRDGQPHGFGTLSTDDGDIYEGGWRDGKRHGYGELIWNDGSRYAGFWHDGEMEGQGTLTTHDGDRYKGEFRNGLFHGQGEYRWADGSEYRGEWQSGQRHGVGTMVWAGDGARDGNFEYYEGEWVNDKPFGYGMVIWVDGTTYEGEMADGVPNGFGIMTETDGLRYEGEFSAGRASGGILTVPSGQRYWATMTADGTWDWTRALEE